MTTTKRLFVVLMLLGIATTGMAGRAAAEETRTTALAEHAVVGSWFTATDAGTAAFAPVLMTFRGDGTYADVGANGGTKAGTWQPRGANAVALTAVVVLRDRSGAFLGSTTILGTLTLSDDGRTLAGTYTIELTGADRTSSGPIGLGSSTSTRLVGEPPSRSTTLPRESGPR